MITFSRCLHASNVLLIYFFVLLDWCYAHTVQQKFGTYEDNQGYSKQRLNLSIGIEKKSLIDSSLNSNNISIDLRQDRVNDPEREDSDYSKQHYDSTTSYDRGASLGLQQTWSKLTNTRLMAAYSSDNVVKTQSFGAGISRWFLGEQLEASLDISRTEIDRPAFEYLGADSDAEFIQPQLTSVGVSTSLKHLMNPTTIATYGYTSLKSQNRPTAHFYAVGVRQFIRPTKSAIHCDVVRGINRGRLTSSSEYGEVDAWSVQPAFLQELAKDIQARVYYRFYKEDERTRVEKQEYTRGTDTYGFQLNLNFERSNIQGLTAPLSIQTGASRFLSNEIDDDGKRVKALMIEVGATAKI